MITDPLSSLNNLYAKDDSRQDERIFRGICCSSDPGSGLHRATASSGAVFARRGRTDCPCRDKELGFRLSLSLGSL
jgi:hypothetical protein